jgi:hypothetical protein
LFGLLEFIGGVAAEGFTFLEHMVGFSDIIQAYVKYFSESKYA